MGQHLSSEKPIGQLPVQSEVHGSAPVQWEAHGSTSVHGKPLVCYLSIRKPMGELPVQGKPMDQLPYGDIGVFYLFKNTRLS